MGVEEQTVLSSGQRGKYSANFLKLNLPLQSSVPYELQALILFNEWNV
jgi:hypothetical protein